MTLRPICSVHDRSCKELGQQDDIMGISREGTEAYAQLQVKGSGIANTCPVIEGGSSNLKDLKAGNYKIQKFCMEPTSFKVKEESQFKGGNTEFAPTKLMTRLTYTLDEVRTLWRYPLDITKSW